MLWFQCRIRTHERAPGPYPGVIALCADCHDENWYLFRFADQPEIYAQCSACGRVELLVSQENSQPVPCELEQPPISGVDFARELIKRGWQP